MPSDSNGVYSLPSGYLAVTGQTIEASQHNPPLEDLATAMSARLPKNGAAPMTGPLKLVDGSSSAPAIAFATAPGVGLYKSGSGMAAVGLISAVPVGGMISFAGLTIPTGWLQCYGQSLLRSSYPALFNVIGTIYGAVDGTHFSLPDSRSVVEIAPDDMGGVGRGLIATAGLGSVSGAVSVTINQGNLPNYTLPNTLGISDTRTWGFDYTQRVLNQDSSPVNANQSDVSSGGNTKNIATTGGSISITGSVTLGGSGTPLSVVQPSIVLYKIIFTGVA